MNKKVSTMYFSPTDATKKVVTELANNILNNMGVKVCGENIDFTLPEVRKEPVSFTEEDIVIIGVPVYAGRVPNVLLKYLNTIKGNGARTIPIVVYGNRNYDDALIELKDILESNGFVVIAGGAFVGEHSFSKTLAKNRPDDKDMIIVRAFANQIYKKMIAQDTKYPLVINGNKPYRNYYKPKDKNGDSVDIRKVVPKINSHCIHCKLCVSLCPMGSIDTKDISKFNGICIKCGACIKKCPTGARYYDDMNYLRHKHELEVDFADRREPQVFL